jgi:hypothetical protein
MLHCWHFSSFPLPQETLQTSFLEEAFQNSGRRGEMLFNEIQKKIISTGF